MIMIASFITKSNLPSLLFDTFRQCPTETIERSGMMQPYPAYASPNSKHWFTTSFLQCLLEEGAGKRCLECSTSHTPRNSYEIRFTGIPVIIPRNSLRDTEQNPNVRGENRSSSYVILTVESFIKKRWVLQRY